MSDRFDVSKSTFHAAVTRVAKCTVDEIMPQIVRWPEGTKQQDTSNSFSEICGIQGVVGAVDGSHIEITSPYENPMAYYNQNKFYSIILLAVCDSKLNFTYVWAGNPGSSHDAAVLRTCSLFNKADDIISNGHFILGDSAFPLLSWIITPFRNFGNLTADQRLFNTCHSKTRQVIERSFRLLKARFRRLTKFPARDLSLVVHSVLSACVLHNICIHNGEAIFEPDNSASTASTQTQGQVTGPQGYQIQGVRIRQDIMNHLRQLHA